MTTSTTESVSREAHERMVKERDDAKARVAELEQKLTESTQVTQAALARQKYLEHRAGMDENLKPIVAELDIATPMLNGVDYEQLDEQVQAVAEKVMAFRGPVTQPAAEPAPETREAPAETAVPNVPQPNPGAAGAAAKTEVLGMTGRTEVVQREGMAGVRSKLASGEIQLDPEVRERHGL